MSAPAGRPVFESAVAAVQNAFDRVNRDGWRTAEQDVRQALTVLAGEGRLVGAQQAAELARLEALVPEQAAELEALRAVVVDAAAGNVAAAAEVRKLRARVAELEAAPLMVYRASHDSIVAGLYTTMAAAREHCEALLSSEYPPAVAILFDWIGDDSDPEEPWELVAEIDGADEQPTGYVVTPLTVAAAYDPEAES